MKKQVFLKWVSCVVIVALGTSNLTGCGVIILGRGITVDPETDRSEETRQTEELAQKDVELVATATADKLDFGLSYQPYYQIQSRSVTKKTVKTMSGTSNTLFIIAFTTSIILETVIFLAIFESLEEGETYEDLYSADKKTINYILIDGLLGLLGAYIFGYRTSTDYTPWKPSGTKPGPPEPIPNHPVSISLPQFQYQGSYSTNAAGKLIIPASELIGRISSLDPILRTSLIKVDASTNLEGQSHQKSFTMFRSSGPFRTLYNEAKKLRQTPPADLITTVAFSDADALVPNDVLDAGESGKLHITVTNQGQGTGFDVRLQLSADHPSVQLAANTKALGTIQPNRKATAIVPITASLAATAGVANILVETKEKRGYDAQKLQHRLPVRRLQPAQLQITQVQLNDQKQGNGNGVPENGETIELNVFVRNTGTGDALNTRLELVNAQRGLEVPVRSVNLGTIRANRTATGVLRVGIPRTFAGSVLAYELRLSGPRLAAVSQQKSHPIQQRVPQLVIADRVVTDTNGDGKMQQGESVEFELTVANRGQLAALNARLTVAAQDTRIRIAPNKRSLGRLAPNGTSSPQRFTFTIPRAVPPGDLPIVVEVTHDSFPSVKRTLKYQVYEEDVKITE